MPYGVDSTGFASKPLTVILDDKEAREKASIDPALDVSPAQPLGQLNGIHAADTRDAWELAEAVYNSFDPDKAEGVPLDNLCALTGTYRKAATFTKVAVTLTFGAAATIPQGSLVSVVGHPEIVCALDAAVTRGSAGTSPGTMTCTTSGPIEINAGTLTEIVTPVSGWSSVTNAADGDPGEAVETDTALRKRRILELQGAGNGSPDGIRADLLKVTGVEEALVLENRSDVTTLGYLPPHSLQAIVWDGSVPAAADLDIGKAIWRNRSAGIGMYGATDVTVVDALGVDQVVSFDRATQKLLYVDITLKKNSAYGGDTAVKEAIVALVNSTATRRLGRDVVALAVKAAPLTVEGVEDVTICELDFSASPSATANLPVADTEIAIASAARITIAYV